jgi:catechol 2,3-dioxygenase-like lactoylglutathione lyase family enzyme
MKPRSLAVMGLLILFAGTAVYAEPEGSFFAVIVSDIDKSVKWYESTFGLSPGERLSESGRYEIVNLRKPGLYVELLQLTAAAERPEYVKGLFKVGILTSDLTDFVALLPESIPKPEILTDTTNGLLLMQLRDPDGNIIQIMELLMDEDS